MDVIVTDDAVEERHRAVQESRPQAVNLVWWNYWTAAGQDRLTSAGGSGGRWMREG